MSKPYEIGDFSGGVVRDSKRLTLAPNQCRIARNFYIHHATGRLIKRRGFTKYNDTAVPGAKYIDTITRYYNSTVRDTVIGAATTTYSKILHDGGGVSGWTEITGGSDLACGDRIRFQVARDYLLLCNGNVMQYWAGTGNTKADVTYVTGSGYYSALKPRLLSLADNRLYVVNNVDAQRNQVWFSVIGIWTTDPGTDIEFGELDFITIPYRIGDQRGITALWPDGFNNDLLVFRENDYYRLVGTGPDDYLLWRVPGPGGCMSADGVCDAEDFIVFVGNGNVYAYDGRNETYTIGDEIAEEMKDQNLEESCCTYFPDIKSVVVSWPGAAWCWNVKTHGWTKWDSNAGPHTSCTLMAAADKRIVLFNNKTDNYLYQHDYGTTDTGATITTVFRSDDLDMGAASVTKKVMSGYIQTNNIAPTQTVRLMGNGNKHYWTGDATVGPEHTDINLWATSPTDKTSMLWSKAINKVKNRVLRWVRRYPMISSISVEPEVSGTTIAIQIETSDADKEYLINKIVLDVEGLPREV